MPGKQEKSKHGGKEHRELPLNLMRSEHRMLIATSPTGEPTHLGSGGNASSSQWSSNTQPDYQTNYEPNYTPRSSPLPIDDLSSGFDSFGLGGSGSVNDPPYYSSGGDPNAGELHFRV
jgi:hypothetical protein